MSYNKVKTIELRLLKHKCMYLDIVLTVQSL